MSDFEFLKHLTRRYADQMAPEDLERLAKVAHTFENLRCDLTIAKDLIKRTEIKLREATSGANA